ncbi:divergent polysaccharide deacetylase family protein [Rhodopseudomonas palustris]|uniref:Divergent polysaccharide deacetylase family protein n=1 Tax=Rhodopseudomonas palustris (strain DX-1) TaxID=652103 RepID=E6VJW0_RHOPX|nr:divergent polysaccharide deacetylase family protein [Rhodopseudomonas palustris]QDL99538.1 divergent polysaccharide deacetylase family protein [Rhodopseudomonas palustris]
MAADELSTPLGQKRSRWQRLRHYRLPFNATQAIATLLGVFVLAFLGFAIFSHDPLGGEPVVRLEIPPAADAPKQAAAAPAKAPDGKAENAPAAGPDQHGGKQAAPGQKTITIIDGSKGTRQDVVVGADTADKSEPPGGASAVAADGINPKLLEQSRYGMIPVMAGGLKPFNAYAMATDAERAKAERMPTVTIVVGGLGIGAARTNDAVMKLPAPVTLAFTPYGSDPGKLATEARAKRHEIILQIPMEPFDYPDNDPGPQTLLTSSAPEQNLDRLNWHLSRIQGYVGLSNFMGARFVATEPAMQAIIRDAAKRGLGYLDDGTAPRSVAGTLANSLAIPFARADLTIDQVPAGADIDKALTRLESIAKERGSAIGMASALPVTIERIVNWSKSLESRGIVLVPLTTAMLKSKSS